MAEETSWTEERLEKLQKLWDSGLSISQIGEQLGVTRNACLLYTSDAADE